MSFPTRIDYAEACAIIDRVAASALLDSEDCSLSRALGRILAADVVSTQDLPPFDNSAMDGFAVRAADLSDGATLRLVGDQFAGGQLAATPLCAGECLRITTGAPVPPGADTVVIKENCELVGDAVRVGVAPAPGANIRRAAEDVRRGDCVLREGQVLAPAALALAAALGEPTLRARRKPTVALFTTGDELQPPGSVLESGQIYDSNRVLLQTLLIADGFEPVAWPVLPDDPARIAVALRDAADAFDVVITCGGVSAGEKDFLPGLLMDEGRVHFWKVLMRPGMPVLAGQLEKSQLLCLPGNPVSVLATYLTLGRRLLDGIQGRREARPRAYARLLAPIHKRHERLEFLRGSVAVDQRGQATVLPDPADGSHRLRAAASANALIVVPAGAGDWPAGDVLEVLPLERG